jgi:hypothetical protein
VASVGRHWEVEREDGDGGKEFWVKTRSEVTGWLGVVTGAWRLLRRVSAVGSFGKRVGRWVARDLASVL